MNKKYLFLTVLLLASAIVVAGDFDMRGNYSVQACNVVLSDADARRCKAADANTYILNGGAPTGIVSIETANQTNKLFDMQGRQVNLAKKGVYIVNGKKVVVR